MNVKIVHSQEQLNVATAGEQVSCWLRPGNGVCYPTVRRFCHARSVRMITFLVRKREPTETIVAVNCVELSSCASTLTDDLTRERHD